MEEASVACRQLGYQYAEGIGSSNWGEGRIVLRAVNCNGNEDRIGDCFGVFNSKYCDHSDDVAVVCSNVQTTEAPPDISPGE